MARGQFIAVAVALILFSGVGFILHNPKSAGQFLRRQIHGSLPQTVPLKPSLSLQLFSGFVCLSPANCSNNGVCSSDGLSCVCNAHYDTFYSGDLPPNATQCNYERLSRSHAYGLQFCLFVGIFGVGDLWLGNTHDGLVQLFLGLAPEVVCISALGMICLGACCTCLIECMATIFPCCRQNLEKVKCNGPKVNTDAIGPCAICFACLLVCVALSGLIYTSVITAQIHAGRSDGNGIETYDDI